MPTDYSAKIARDTQLYLQNHSDMTSAVDPWGGSYYVEYLTDQLARKAWTLIGEIEEMEKNIPEWKRNALVLQGEETKEKKAGILSGLKNRIRDTDAFETLDFLHKKNYAGIKTNVLAFVHSR